MIDVFKIGVSIGLTNNVSQALGAIQRDLFGLGKTVDLTTRKFGLMKVAALGAMSAIGGTVALKGMLDLVHAGERVNEQLARMKATGYSAGAVAANKLLAGQLASAIPGTTWSGNLATLAMLRAQLSNSEEARAALPAVAKAEVAAHVLGINDADFQKLLKGLDIRGSFVKNGVLDPKMLAMAVNEGVAALALSHGLLTGKDVFQYIRMAGPAADLGDLHTFLADNIEMMMTLGRTGGRGLMYFWKSLIGGNVTKAEAEALERTGAVSGPIGETAGHYALKPGQIVGYKDLMAKGPIWWFYHDLKPSLAKHGIKTDQQIEGALAAFPVTMQRVIAFLLSNEAQVEKGRAQFDKAVQVNQYDSLQKNSPAAQLMDFTKAWAGLMEAMGQPIVKVAYHALGEITKRLLALEAWAIRNPQTVRVIDLFVTGLSGLAVALGAFAVGTAAASALGILTAPTGLIALGIGLTALAQGLNSIPAWMQKVMQVAADTAVGAGIGAKFGGGPGAVVGGLLGFGTSLESGTPTVNSVEGQAAKAADAKYGHGNWHWGWSWWSGDYIAPNSSHTPSLRAGAGHGDNATPVYIVNPGDIGHAVVHGAARAATHAPTTPTPNAFTWGPGLSLTAP